MATQPPVPKHIISSLGTNSNLNRDPEASKEIGCFGGLKRSMCGLRGVLKGERGKEEGV